MSLASRSNPMKGSIIVFGIGFLVLLVGMQWMAQAGRKHIRTASQSLFPAALKIQEASAAFERMNREYAEAVVTEQRSALDEAEHAAIVVRASLESTRVSLSFNAKREKQIADLIRRLDDLHDSSKTVYLQSTDSNLTLATQARLSNLAHENKVAQASIDSLRNEIAGDFKEELAQIQRLSELQFLFGAVLFVVIIAILYFSTRAIIDITAQRSADETLRQAHKETEVLLDSVPSLLIGVDPAGCIRRWNRAASLILGWDENTVAGKSLGSCGVNWLTDDLDAKFLDNLRDNAVEGLDHIRFDKDHSVRFLDLKVIQLWSDDGTLNGSLVVGADITERTILEEQLRQAQKLEAIGQLAAGIAHEINTPTQFVSDNVSFFRDSWNPIAALLQFTQVIQKEIVATGEISSESGKQLALLLEESDLEYLLTEIPISVEQSLDGLQRVAKIVRSMKEFSHQGFEGKTPVDINRAIETTIAVAKNEWKYVADIITNFDENLPLVPGLRGELNQTILNLVINAAHAIADVKGSELPKKGKITISTRRDGDSVEIAIEDNGTGIPEEVQERIFEPFFTTKEVGKGTGQGLSLAHSTIVKRHQGRIWFESEMGKGTTFLIQLPLEANP